MSLASTMSVPAPALPSESFALPGSPPGSLSHPHAQPSAQPGDEAHSHPYQPQPQPQPPQQSRQLQSHQGHPHRDQQQQQTQLQYQQQQHSSYSQQQVQPQAQVQPPQQQSANQQPAGSSNPTSNTSGLVYPALHLYPVNDTFVPKQIALAATAPSDQGGTSQRIRIGRQTNTKTVPQPHNGFFDSKVLSRIHAEVWYQDGTVWIKDVKSSNGTFINGERLSGEGVESDPWPLRTDDLVEFGIDIAGEDPKTILHHKVATRVYVVRSAEDAMQWRSDFARLYHGGSPGSLGQSATRGSLGPVSETSGLLRRRFGPGSLPASSAGGLHAHPAQHHGHLSHNSGSYDALPSRPFLSFDHLLARLQDELSTSRQTGAKLGQVANTFETLHKSFDPASRNPAGTTVPAPANAPGPAHPLPPSDPIPTNMLAATAATGASAKDELALSSWPLSLPMGNGGDLPPDALVYQHLVPRPSEPSKSDTSHAESPAPGSASDSKPPVESDVADQLAVAWERIEALEAQNKVMQSIMDQWSGCLDRKTSPPPLPPRNGLAKLLHSNKSDEDHDAHEPNDPDDDDALSVAGTLVPDETEGPASRELSVPQSSSEPKADDPLSLTAETLAEHEGPLAPPDEPPKKEEDMQSQLVWLTQAVHAMQNEMRSRSVPTSPDVIKPSKALDATCASRLAYDVDRLQEQVRRLTHQIETNRTNVGPPTSLPEPPWGPACEPAGVSTGPGGAPSWSALTHHPTKTSPCDSTSTSASANGSTSTGASAEIPLMTPSTERVHGASAPTSPLLPLLPGLDTDTRPAGSKRRSLRQLKRSSPSLPDRMAEREWDPLKDPLRERSEEQEQESQEAKNNSTSSPRFLTVWETLAPPYCSPSGDRMAMLLVLTLLVVAASWLSRYVVGP